MSSKSYYVNGLLLGLYIMWWMCFKVVEENASIIRWLNRVCGCLVWFLFTGNDRSSLEDGSVLVTWENWRKSG